MACSADLTSPKFWIARPFAVVDFHQTSKPRNYLARREQWRLLLLVMSLGLVVVLMYEARDPDNWRWFTSIGDEPQGEATPAQGPPIDTRLQPPPSEEEIPGTFVSPGPVEAAEDTSGRYFPGVEPKYLELVRDDTTFRNDETQAWRNLFEILSKTDEETLQRAPIRVSYAQLFKQSDEYRGELVTVRGTVRRANPIGAPTKDFEFERYYRVWLFPDDNPSLPIVVYCLNLPDGFPRGMEIAEEAEITGFYFKRWAYKAVDSMRTAPTLAARTVRWHKASEESRAAPMDAGTWALVIGVAAVFCLFVSVYVYTRTRSGRAEEGGVTPNFDALRDADLPSDVGPPPDQPDDQEPGK